MPFQDKNFNLKIEGKMAFWGNIYRQRRKKRYRITGTRGTDHPPFSNFLFTNLFSIKFLYFFIISSLFPYFNLFVSIFIQSYINIKLHVSTLFLHPAGIPGYRNGTESFFGLKWRPSDVRDVKIHNQPVLRMRRK
jgi:hypothetical protein